MASEFWLSEEQFGRLAPLLPTDTRGVARVDDRRVISGIVHVLMSGGRWVDAPACYGPKKTLYNRWVRWAKTRRPRSCSRPRVLRCEQQIFNRSSPGCTACSSWLLVCACTVLQRPGEALPQI